MHELRISRWIAFAVATLGFAFFAKDAYVISLINLIALAALTASSLRFIMLIGEVSFATAAFFGMGAYAVGVATTVYQWPFPLALLAGALIATVLSAIFGAITLRIRGPFFMLIGFAFAEAVRLLYTKSDLLGGTSGLVGIYLPQYMDRWLPVFIVAIVLVLIFALYVIERSDFGRVLNAIRDNENLPKTVGINVLACKVICFAIASFCAGIAGGLHAFANNVISPGDFGYLLGAFALAHVKVGGETSVAGPIAGAILLSLLGSYALGLGAGEQLFYGGAIVIAVMLLPQGLTGLVTKAIDRLRARATPPDADEPAVPPVQKTLEQHAG